MHSIESHRDRLALEFRLLKYTPRPWTVTDSLLVGARMVQDLNHYRNPPALTREKILAKLGPELTADLYVNSSWRDRPPTEVRRMEDEPAVHSGDEEDDDDEEVDHRMARDSDPVVHPPSERSSASSAWRECLHGHSGRRRSVPAGVEQLGRFRSAYGFREAAAVERHAPRPPDAEPVV